MRIQQFQVSLVDQARKQLPRPLRNFDVRSFFTVVKLSYRQPRIHYEVWVRGKERLIEVGLHFEADKKKNDALLQYFDERAIEVHAELGPRIEIEQWTNSWSRVHEVLPYESLDTELVERVAAKLARMMAVLQPMLDEYDGYKPAARTAAATRTANKTSRAPGRSERAKTGDGQPKHKP